LEGLEGQKLDYLRGEEGFSKRTEGRGRKEEGGKGICPHEKNLESNDYKA